MLDLAPANIFEDGLMENNLEEQISNIIDESEFSTFYIDLENYNLEMHKTSNISIDTYVFAFIFNIKNKYWFKPNYNFDQLKRFLKKKKLFEKFESKIEEELLRRL